MKLHQIVAILVLNCASFYQASKLPSFITPCKGTDPNLRECAIKEANKVIPHLLNGYPPFNVPSFLPFKIQHVHLQNGGQLNVSLNNINAYGFEETKAIDFDVDFQAQYIKIKLAVPRLRIVANYEINGVLLFVPLTGRGPCNLTAEDGIYEFFMTYDLYDKDGAQYAKLNKTEANFDVKRAFIYFGNIFNNKRVSDDVNVFFNKEWRQILEELRPILNEALKSVTFPAISGIFDNVSIAELYGNDIP